MISHHMSVVFLYTIHMSSTLPSLLDQIEKNAFAAIKSTETLAALDEKRIEYLGTHGKLAKISGQLPAIAKEERPQVGKRLNQVKQAIEAILDKAKTRLVEQKTAKSAWIDVTAPGKRPTIGHLHPQTIVLGEIISIFTSLGYQVADGVEIESDYYNFEALNIPKDHPARDTQQTFYLSGTDLILRTQLSGMQVRIMERIKPPMRVIIPGKVYRYEQVDASHGFEFWQLEGMLIDKGVRITDLFGTIDYVLRKLFGDETTIRFATTNFPFVEPGVDTYIRCTICKGKGCSFCKQTGWSEIMPAGMVHPKVLEYGHVDSKIWNGFAFCIGLSRVVVLKHQLEDLRVLTDPDMRILEQF